MVQSVILTSFGAKFFSSCHLCYRKHGKTTHDDTDIVIRLFKFNEQRQQQHITGIFPRQSAYKDVSIKRRMANGQNVLHHCWDAWFSTLCQPLESFEGIVKEHPVFVVGFSFLRNGAWKERRSTLSMFSCREKIRLYTFQERFPVFYYCANCPRAPLKLKCRYLDILVNSHEAMI